MTVLPHPLLPAWLAEHSAESLLLSHTAPGLGVYRILLLSTGLALVTLPWIPLDVTLRLPGTVRPVSGRIELRSRVAAPIDRIHVRDNEAVRAGQLLIEFSAPELDARISANRKQQARTAATIADLRSAIGAAADRRPGDPAPNFATPAVRHDFQAFAAEIAARRLDLAQSEREHERQESLAGRGLVSSQILAQAEYEVARHRGLLAIAFEQAAARWQGQLRQETETGESLRAAGEVLGQQRAEFSLTAPSDGTIVGFDGLSRGRLVGNGETLGALSPDEDLTIEAFASSRQAGLIRAGQSARLLVDAFPYTEWGVVPGSVQTVAEDVLPAGPTAGLFRITIRPATEFLTSPHGVQARLRKGLTLSARLVVDRRPVWQLLYDRSTARENQAGR